jgi:hypothetical protein
MRQLGILLVVVLLGSVVVARAQVVKKEPPLGALKPGEVVLVDDGSCPSGQIKRVVGGDHKKVGGKNLVERRRSCVNR